MDSLLDSDYATRGPHVPAMVPPPGVPRWVAGLGFLTLVLAVAAVLCVALLFAQSVSNSVAAPAVIVLVILVLGCGVVAIVGRDVHGAVITDAGHWIMEEQPAQAVAVIVPFLSKR